MVNSRAVYSAKPKSIARMIMPVLLLLLLHLQVALHSARGQDTEVDTDQHISKLPAAGWVREFPSDFATAVPTDNERRALSGIWNVLAETQEDSRSQTKYYHYARRFLTDEAVGRHADVTFNFDPNYQRLIFHALRVHRDGEVIDHLPTQSFEVVRTEEESERQVYSRNLKAIAMIEGVRAGDVLEYAASIAGKNPVFENVFASSYSVRWKVPIREARHRILLPLDPSGKRLVATVNGDSPMEGKVHNDHVEYLWEGRDLSPVVIEDDVPDWFLPYDWIEVSDYGDWQTVADWAARQYPVTSELPEELNREIDTIRALESEEEKVLAALRYVQDKVRYVGMFSGVHTHRPYPLDLIVRRGFGDCKDKTLMLCSILQALGIDAVPALVNTTYRHVIADWPPSPKSFNHLITTVQVDGQRYWIDPTRRAQRGALRSVYLPNYAKALIIQAGTTDLTDIPRQGHAESKIEIIEAYTFPDYAGGAEMRVETVYSGAEADRIRRSFATESHDRIQKGYVDHYSDIYSHIEAIGEIETNDDTPRNQFTVIENYAISNLWTTQDEDDPDYRATDFSALAFSNALDVPDNENRKMPFAISHPLDIKQVLKLNFPTDLMLEVEQLSLRNSAFEFDYRETYAGTTLTSAFHYRSLSDHVPPEQIAKYAADIEKAGDNTAFWISIPEGYRHGDYDSGLLAALGLEDNRHVIGIVAAILIGSVIGGIGLIVGLIVYANRSTHSTHAPKPAPAPASPPVQTPGSSPPPLPPTDG